MAEAKKAEKKRKKWKNILNFSFRLFQLSSVLFRFCHFACSTKCCCERIFYVLFLYSLWICLVNAQLSSENCIVLLWLNIKWDLNRISCQIRSIPLAQKGKRNGINALSFLVLIARFYRDDKNRWGVKWRKLANQTEFTIRRSPRMQSEMNDFGNELVCFGGFWGVCLCLSVVRVELSFWNEANRRTRLPRMRSTTAKLPLAFSRVPNAIPMQSPPIPNEESNNRWHFCGAKTIEWKWKWKSSFPTVRKNAWRICFQ